MQGLWKPAGSRIRDSNPWKKARTYLKPIKLNIQRVLGHFDDRHSPEYALPYVSMYHARVRTFAGIIVAPASRTACHALVTLSRNPGVGVDASMSCSLSLSASMAVA